MARLWVAPARKSSKLTKLQIFDARGMTACCLQLPHSSLHETCQCSSRARTGVSIYVFNGLRENNVQVGPPHQRGADEKRT
jgi:hypothetical protein